MPYAPTLQSAIEFSQNGRLEAWVHTFLQNEGGNASFSEGLLRFPRLYTGPFLMPISLFSRSCGPEEGMKYRVPKEGFSANVNGILERLQTGAWDMPPLIVQKTGEGYELSDGNHRHKALQLLNIKEYHVIFWETKKGTKNNRNI